MVISPVAAWLSSVIVSASRSVYQGLSVRVTGVAPEENSRALLLGRAATSSGRRIGSQWVLVDWELPVFDVDRERLSTSCCPMRSDRVLQNSMSFNPAPAIATVAADQRASMPSRPHTRTPCL